MKKSQGLNKFQLVFLTLGVLFVFIFSIFLYSAWVSQRYRGQIKEQLLERARLLASQYVDYGALRPFIMRQTGQEVLFNIRLVSLNLIVGLNQPDNFELIGLQRLYADRDMTEYYGDDKVMGIDVFRYMRKFKYLDRDAAVSMVISREALLKAYRDNMRDLIVFASFLIVLTLASTSIFLRRMIMMTLDLDRTNVELVKLEGFKEDLSKMLVHDLKNPLTVIITSLAMLKDGMMGKVAEAQKNILALSKDSAERLLGMIMTILDVAKLEEGKLELHPQEIDLKAFLLPLVDRYAAMARPEGKQVRLGQAFSQPRVRVDSGVLTRLLDNLVSNSLKHTEVNKGAVEVSVSHDPAAKSVTFSVKDNGEGIPAEYIDKVFDKFVQVESRKLGTKLDTGLGLTFCKLAVTAMGGRIWVESQPGQGATFSFTIPLKSNT